MTQNELIRLLRSSGPQDVEVAVYDAGMNRDLGILDVHLPGEGTEHFVIRVDPRAWRQKHLDGSA